MNSAQSRTASRQPFQAHTVYTGGIALKQKAIYLLNTPSGLFIAVVQGTIRWNLNVLPAAGSAQVNQSDFFTEWGM